MSHEITATDNLFTVREPAWHGLGEVYSDYPDRAKAQAKAHPWEPVTEPLFRRVPLVHEDGRLEETYQEVTSHVLNVRDDNQGELGVVSTTFQTVTNNEMWDIAEALQGNDAEVRYETAGSLRGGAKVWVLIRMNEPLVVGGDPNGATVPYYALQNAHDGSASFRGQAVMDRIVCANTAHVADLDAAARGTEFTFRHTKSVSERVEEAKAALAGWRHSVAQWQRICEFLLDQPVSPHQRERFVIEFIPMPAPHTVSDRVVDNVNGARDQLREILGGPTCEGINNSAYGLVQAAVEYLEHYRRANSRETRFKRAMLDRSKMVADARALAVAVAE